MVPLHQVNTRIFTFVSGVETAHLRYNIKAKLNQTILTTGPRISLQ